MRETPRRPPVISSRKFVKGIVRKISTVFSLKWLYIKCESIPAYEALRETLNDPKFARISAGGCF